MARKQYTGPAVHLPALFYISRIQSDSEGSTMDLQYLLFLQQLRTTSCSWLTPVMMLISHLAVNGSLIICVAVFWGMNRELGYWLISNCLSSLFFNNALKLTACIYRPWIRCPELVPPSGAIKGATGYSFPSGHTQIAGSFFGSIAARYGKEKKGLAVFCVAMILLTAFSRNFLGVHTPQDVLAAMASSAVIVFANVRLFEKLRNDLSLLPKAIAVGCVAAVLCILYFALKSYPMDYVDGALVVDPAEMKEDGYAAAGATLGALIGAFLETRYVKFSTDGTIPLKIIRVLMGIPAAALIMLVVRKPVYDLIGRPAGHVVIYFAVGIYIIFLYPAIFTAIHRRRLQSHETPAQD